MRMVFDQERDHPSRWAAVLSISEKIGCVPQTLHERVKKAEVDSGKRAGIPTELAGKVKALEREVRKLRQAEEILRKPVLSLPKGHRHIVRRRRSTDRSGEDRLR